MLQQEFSRLDYTEFRRQVERASHILYIGDNVGETVYDRILIKTMNKHTTFAVREKPIINDATVGYARAAGLYNVARIISSGSPNPGAPLHLCTPEIPGALPHR